MKKNLQLAGMSVGLGLGVALSACAAQDSVPLPSGLTGAQGGGPKGKDDCSPARVVSSLEDPFATCAVATQYSVPDLALKKGNAGGVAPQGVGGEGGLGLQDVAGAPVRPSCNGKVGPGYDTCGADHKQSCCAVASVPDGRVEGVAVGAFDLDVYEVTSGRFEAFVAATGGNLRGAAAAADWPGWKDEWNEKLPASRAEVDDELGPSCKFRSALDDFGALTWPADRIVQSVNGYMVDDNDRAADIRADATPDRLHQKPINCVSYYVAAAFCAWDGGRLPSDAEWSYAASGGAEARTYPWGPNLEAVNTVTDLKPEAGNQFTFPDDFPYNGLGMNAYHIAPPGSKPLGRSRWGHEDLGGNVLEWTAEYRGETGAVRGGSWEGHAVAVAASKHSNYPLDRTYGSLGMRCAHGAVAPKVTVAIPEPSLQQPVYRAYDAQGGWFNQGSRTEVVESPGEAKAMGAYAAQGIAFRLQAPASKVPQSRELHRCMVAGTRDVFVSNDALCEGQQHLASLGFAYDAEQPGTLPLYRCYGNPGTHLSTVTPAECGAAGLHVEGLQGWVIPPPPGAYVRHVYQQGLGREPEVDGYAGWMDGFRVQGCNAQSLAAFGRAAYTSPEFMALALTDAQRLDRLYQGILDRAPDPGGLQAALDQLKTGQATWEQIAGGVAASPEAATLAPKRCENVAAQGDGPGQGGGNADSCATREDGWYCSDIDGTAAFHCAGHSTAGAASCAQGQTCERDGDRAKMEGDLPVCH